MDIEAARARLEADLADTSAQIRGLEHDFAGIVASASDGSSGGDDEHDPEGATVAFERQHVAALLDQARRHLAAIGMALRKLDDGAYGTCDRCGQPIGAERLAALPATPTCVRCAGRQVRRP